MRKKLTTKSLPFLFFIVFLSPLSIQAFSTALSPDYRAFATETVENKAYLPMSLTAEDIVIEDILMVGGRSSSPCGYGAPQIKTDGDSFNIMIEDDSTWAAKFNIRNSELKVSLIYNAQTNVLSFIKTLGAGMTYQIARDNSFITFYLDGRPFLVIDKIRNCGSNACAKIRFLSRMTVSLSDCNSSNHDTASRNNRVESLISANNGINNTMNNYEVLNALHNSLPISPDVFKKTTIITTSQVAPNPINNHTAITYYLKTDVHVQVSIYNTLGQRIEVLVNQNQTNGEHVIEWRTNDLLREGIYFCEIIANNERMVEKVIKQ